MNKHQADFKALQLQAEASGYDEVETMAFFLNEGLPMEVVTRMDVLWQHTMEITGVVFDIGKIIIIKLIQFIKENPNMAIGVALGIGLGVLAGMIPFIGIFIAPIVTLLGVTIGALRGHRLDKIMKGEYVGDSLMEDAITMTKLFLGLFADIWNTIFNEPYITYEKRRIA